MPLIQRVMMYAARKFAADPRVRAKAADVLENDVKPRAKAAWQATKPRLQAARDELSEIADEVDPLRQPGRFVREVKRRFIDDNRD